MIEMLFAIFAFVYIFNMLPLEPTIKMFIDVLGLVLIVCVMFVIPHMHG